MLARPYIVKIRHSTALASHLLMSYLDVFKKKPTIFADGMVIKRNNNVVR